MKKRALLIAFLLLAITLLNASEAQNNPDKESDLTFASRMLRLIENSGFNLEVSYTSDFVNLSGTTSMKQKVHYIDNFSLGINTDLEAVFGIPSTEFRISILGSNGATPNEYGHTIQGFSNIETERAWKLYDFQLESEIIEDQLSVLFGLYDLNSEFDVLETASFFINPSHGIGAEYALSGPGGPPIFPNTALAFRIDYLPADNYYMRTAVMDGFPGDPTGEKAFLINLSYKEGVLTSFETGYLNETDVFDRKFVHLAAGGWFYSSKNKNVSLTDEDNGESAYCCGLYVSAEKNLLELTNTSSLSGFVRLGYANGSVQQTDRYLGCGLAIAGLFGGRENDVLGLALATAGNSQEFIDLQQYKKQQSIKYEYNFELTYQAEISNNISIQPDLQYFLNSAGAESKNLIVTALRVLITL